MTKQSKALPIVKIVLFSILFAVLTAALVIGIVFGNTGFNLLMLNIMPYDDTGYSAISGEMAEINSTAIKNITLDWESGQIKIVKSSDKTIFISEIYENGDDVSADDGLRYKVNGGKLTIHSRKPQFYIGFGAHRNKSLTLALPEKQYDTLKIDTVSAALNVSDAQISKLSVNSVSGIQTYLDVTADTIDIDNVSGNLTFTGCKTATLNCDGISRKVDYSGSITDSIDINTVSGEISIKTDVTPRKIDSDSTSADFTLWLPYNASFTATTDSISGDFNSDFATTLKGSKYVCGSGQSDFNFDSTSGSVQIYSIR